MSEFALQVELLARSFKVSKAAEEQEISLSKGKHLVGLVA
jgi:hypothetical protein